MDAGSLTEIRRICVVEGNTCDLRLIDVDGINRMHDILANRCFDEDDPDYEKCCSLYLRSLALNFEGIPSPMQLRSFERIDLPSACIVLYKSMQLCISNLDESVQNNSMHNDVVSLEKSVRQYLTRVEVAYPTYEQFAVWVRLFQEYCRRCVDKYCYEYAEAI